MNAATVNSRIQIDTTLDYELAGPCDFVFMIQATAGMGQTIAQEQFSVEPATPWRTYTHAPTGNRFVRLQAPPGPLRVSYHALVDKVHEVTDPGAPEVPVHDIPDELLRFLMPTRYCESDLLAADALRLFGTLPPGHGRVQAICDWVHANVTYQIGSTVATTTARDVFAQRSGVCRDFAHLAVTFCRALNIPARLVCGYAHFDEPPPDFHAVFEAFLGGRWVSFDPSGMAPVSQVVRVATGRDAKDVAFATIFGPARMVAMSPQTVCLQPAVPAPAPAPVLTPAQAQV